MNDSRSRNIVNFYLLANKNKEKIVSNISNDREYSMAEATVMACLNELFLNEENSDLRIKYLLLESLYNELDCLKKGNDFKEIVLDSSNFNIPWIYDKIINNKIDEKYSFYEKYLPLRKTIRKGHLYWNVDGKRLESVIEHIYGCLVLLIGIESEYDYLLDYNKIMKMLLLHETEEIRIGDLTQWDISGEDKERMGKKAVKELFSDLDNADYYISLIDEFNEGESIVSSYARLIDKLEYDLQVKVYEMEGRYDFSNYPRNVVTNSDSVQSIINNGASSVFDVHYEYDKSKYTPIPCLRKVLEEAKKY